MMESVDDRIGETLYSYGLSGDEKEDEVDADNDECFFADATLEDAHHIVESPGGPTTFGHQITQRTLSSKMPPPLPLFGPENSSSNIARRDTQTANNSESLEMKRLTNMDISVAIVQHSTHSVNTNLTINSIGHESENQDELSPSSVRQVEDEEGDLYGQIHGTPHHTSNSSNLRRKRPALPRDIVWATYATIFLPLSFVVPWWVVHRYPDRFGPEPINDQLYHVHEDGITPVIHGWNQVASSHRGHVATLASALLAYMSAVFLSIILYRNPLSGDDGEDERHLAASRITLLSHYASLLMYPILIALLITQFPKADHIVLYTFILFVWGIRDVRTLRKSFNFCWCLNGTSDEGRGRRIFFQTLSCASLDILSRSLRRMVFYRIVSGALLLQLVLVLMWRSALFQGLGVPVDNDNVALWRAILVTLSLVGGKWATAIVARVLGLIASGGVTIWFAQQHRLLAAMSNDAALNRVDSSDVDTEDYAVEMMDINSSEISTTETASDSGVRKYDQDDQELDGMSGATNSTGNDGRSPSKLSNNQRNVDGRRYANPNSPMMDTREDAGSMAEAYAEVNPNEYRSVNDFEDPNVFDDNDWDEEQLINTTGPTRSSLERLHTFRHAAMNSNYIEGTTAKHFLLQATTLSFGSVAQCALLGGVAQLLWSFTRHLQNVHAAAQNRRGHSRSGFQSMSVESEGDIWRDSGRGGILARVRRMIMRSRAKAGELSKLFIRSHTDYGMAHVAAYFKSYQRAALDISALVDSSGKCTT